jgi:Ger(x)C family germination protein
VVKQRIVGSIVLICLCLFMTGCWDMRELQDRNLVLAVGIDTADAGLKPGIAPEQAMQAKSTETFVQPHGTKRYRLSLQLLKLAPGGEEKEESKTYVISNTGESLFEMIRDMLGQTSKSLWFEHIQVIIISEEVLKQVGLSEILDFFKRDAEMRSRIKIYITPGTARSLLEYNPPSKEAGGIYLANLMRQHARNIHVTGARTDLGFTIQYFDSNSNNVLPRIEIADKVVKMGGTAVFKKDKFIGYVDEYAVAGMKFILGTEKSAIVTIECPDHPEHQVIFELFRHDTRLMPHVEGGTIYFTLDINMYGNLGELQGDIELANTMDPQYVHKLEVAFAEEIKRNVLYTERISKEMRVDFISKFAAKMKAYEPDTWEQVKDQWDEMYPNIPLVVSVNVSIRNIGNHK